MFVCLSGDSCQIIGPKGLKYSGFDWGHPGVVIRAFSEIALFNNFSQMIGPKGLKFSEFNGGSPRVVIILNLLLFFCCCLFDNFSQMIWPKGLKFSG